MTEQRRERNRKNSERLTEIIVWSLKNYDLWLRFCHDDTEQGMEIPSVTYFLDQCLNKGFMEIYYILLIKMAGIVNIAVDGEQLIRFLELCVDENLTLDVERIQNTFTEVQEAAIKDTASVGKE